jgi:FixJ family two-component response regulator
MREIRTQSTSRPSAIVYVIDDDASVRKALGRLMRSARLEVKLFESVQQFLDEADLKCPACIVADVRMPGESSLELPALLARQGFDLPVIYVTAHDTDETRHLARDAGASGFFRKPVDDQALLDAIEWALSEKQKA